MRTNYDPMHGLGKEVRLYCLRHITIISAFIAILGVSPSGLGAQSSSTSTFSGSFTSSTGRTIHYRSTIKKDWDTAQPRGLLIFFHGNNYGSEEDMLTSSFSEEALALGLAMVRVASPSSRAEGTPALLFGYDIHSSGTRHWTTLEMRLIHELLQSGVILPNFDIDYDKIIFSGSSQGTCFLAKFIERYAGIYAGGFHAWCGCFWGEPGSSPPRYSTPWMPTYQWTPFSTSFVRSRFRVFVEATTGDFLHKDGVAMTKYYSELLGLETRSDLEAPGGHCAKGATPNLEIWKWLSSISVPHRQKDETDIDGDGLANAVDPDDDNDGALDFIDALPSDPRDWLDTDSDGIGDFEDRDADGDGVDNALDPFSLDPLEWSDIDEDGIGDNLDADDDNDGIPDAMDPKPLQGAKNDQLTFRRVTRGVETFFDRPYPEASVHSRKPESVVYPEPHGDRQSYQYIELGDSANPRFEIMIDRFYRKESCEETLLPALCNPENLNFLYFEHYIDKIWIDRNHNRDLTDDGPPLILARNNRDGGLKPSRPTVTTVLQVPYASGDTFPYGINLWAFPEGLSDGAKYGGASAWTGYVEIAPGRRILVGVVDANLDGLFDSEESPDGFRDLACIDLDRNGVLNECVFELSTTGRFKVVSPVYPGEPFELDGVQHTMWIAPSGHRVTVFPEQARPQTLTKVSGDNQQGLAGEQLAKPFVISVLDEDGAAIAGAVVTFSVTAGGGTLSATSVTTDANGRARTTLTLGSEPGTNTVVATVAGLESETFTATAIEQMAHSLTKVSGDGQEGLAGLALAAPFVVAVLDEDDEAVIGAVVTFAVTGGEGILSATTDTTDANGHATTTLTLILGSDTETNTVAATVEGLEPETFTATAVGQAMPRSLAKVSGDGQESPTGEQLAEPFVVSVLDEDGAAIAGAVVTFSVTAGGGTLSATTDTTDANGQAATRLTLGSDAGTNTVSATVEGLASVTFTATGQEDPLVSLFDTFLGGGKLVALPDSPQLAQNAPNPFNSQTVLAYFLPAASPARVEVFSLSGQRVAVLQQGPQQAGYHRLRWNGRDDAGHPVASGMYLYRLMTEETVLTRKLVLLR